MTNIGAAADANNLLRRKEQDEARTQRLETLEQENEITQEKFEEVARGWSEALEIVIPQDLQEAINRQKGLCRVIVEDKERLVADLQNVNLPSSHGKQANLCAVCNQYYFSAACCYFLKLCHVR